MRSVKGRGWQRIAGAMRLRSLPAGTGEQDAKLCPTCRRRRRHKLTVCYGDRHIHHDIHHLFRFDR
jgi:hypothetical protein